MRTALVRWILRLTGARRYNDRFTEFYRSLQESIRAYRRSVDRCRRILGSTQYSCIYWNE